MFGYVQPLKPELKVKEYEAFKGYYCGLCKTIKEKYTQSARFMLNYDCAVLSLLLSSLSDEGPKVTQERCIASPLKKKTIVYSKEAEYAAAVNVMLGYGKIQDTAIDDRKFYARILAVFFKRLNHRASKNYDRLAEAFDLRLKNLHALEHKKSGSIDEVSSEFAHLLAEVFSNAPYDYIDESSRKTLWHLGYNLGRWIYIADAVDDIIKDDKNGSYNVFLQREYADASTLKKQIEEEAKFNLHYSLSEACKAYELLNIQRDKSLIDNIMYLGLAKKTEDILKGEVHGSV